MANKYIGLLADTNFFIKLAQKKDKDIHKDMLTFLKKHKLEKENIYFSAITCLELFKDKDSNTREEYKKTLSRHTIKNIDEDICMNASNLANAMQYFIDKTKKPPTADLLIGATAFTHQLLIITTDLKDFCPPIFKIKHSHVFLHGGQDYLAIYVVEPNEEAIKEFIDNCEKYAYVPERESTTHSSVDTGEERTHKQITSEDTDTKEFEEILNKIMEDN